MNQRQWLIGILLLLAGFVGFSIINATQQTASQKKPAVQQIDQSANVQGKSISFTVTEGERKKWMIEAENGTYFSDNSGASLKTVIGHFYNDSGKEVLRFTAPVGEYRHKDHAVVLSGGVLAQSVSGEAQPEKTANTSTPFNKPAEQVVESAAASGKAMKMQSESMKWSSRSDEVVASGGVSVDQEGLGTSKAGRCRFTLDLSSVSLEGGVVSEMGL